MVVYLGADWSATDLKVGVAVGDGRSRKFKVVKRNFPAVKGAIEAAKALGGDGAEVRVVIEAGAPGWVEMLHHAGATVYVVDPKQAKSFAASLCSSGAKDDVRDALTLTEMARSPHHTRSAWTPSTDEQTELDVMGTLHEQAQKVLVATEQRVRALLRECLPTLDAVLKRIDHDWVIRLLREVCTPWHAAKVSQEALDAAMHGTKTSRRTLVREALQVSDVPGWTERRASRVAVVMGHLLDQLVFQLERVASIEAELEALTAHHSVRTLAETLGGISTKMSVRLIEAGVSSAPADRDAISVRMGASPVFVGSGTNWKGDPKGHTRMRRAVPARSRATTYLVGMLATRQMRWAAAMYADARARGQKAAHAYRRIARCIYRILAALLTTGESFDEERYITSLKAKGVRWAVEMDAKPA